MGIKSIALAASALALSTSVNAAVILDFTESGNNTNISVSGTFDLSGFNLSSFTTTWVNASSGSGPGTYSEVAIGDSGNQTYYSANGGSTYFELYSNTFSGLFTDNFSGHGIGFWNTTDGTEGNFQIDVDYISGTQLQGSGTFTGYTLSDLGVTQTGLWKTLSNGETVSITINGSGISAVPVPAAVWLFGSGLIGLVGFARRKKA